MGNVAWLKLYNEEIKELFLESLNCDSTTKETYKKLLKTIGKYEEVINKDLYLMSTEEVLDMFAYLKLGSEDTAVVLLTIIKLYKKWAIDEKRISNLDNVLNLRREDAIKFVSNVRRKQQYIKDEDELMRIIQFCANTQYSAIFSALYFQIDGFEHDSLVNLKRSDIEKSGVWINDYTYETDEFGKVFRNKETNEKVIKDIKRRFIEIPENFLEVIEDASIATFYYKANRMSESTKAKTYDLEDSPYIFKQSRKDENNEPKPIDAQIINQRVKKIVNLYSGKKTYKEHKEETEEEKKDRRSLIRLNPKTIIMSGLFNQFRKLEEEKGVELDNSDYEEILSKYNISTNLVPSYKSKYLSFKEIV
jgi:hypothetical protein